MNDNKVNKSYRIEGKLYKEQCVAIFNIAAFILLNPFISLRNAIENILKRYDAKQSILLLGRTRYDSSMLEASGLFDMRKGSDKLVYKGSPETPITFLTVHKAKGLEADNVILLNFQNSLLGFPNKIADDPMLELVLSDSDDYLFAEEHKISKITSCQHKMCYAIFR